MMKKLFFILLLSFPARLIAQNGNFAWARQVGGSLADDITAISHDSYGNLIIAGRLSGTADLDPGAATVFMSSAGDQDIFIAKLNNSGQLIWVKQIGGLLMDGAFSIAVDANNNIFYTGYFAGMVDFDPGSGIYSLNSMGDQDMFFSKLDVNGNHVWTKQVGGTNYQIGWDIMVHTSGHIYLAGIHSGKTDFDPGTTSNFLISAGNADNFIAKYDANGNFVWASGAGMYWMGGLSIALDASGSVYATGGFEGVYDFDPGSGQVLLNSTGGTDVFIAKYNTHGALLWAKHFNGHQTFDDGWSLRLDNNGNIYLTGEFTGAVDFDPGTQEHILSSNGSYDAFIAKYDMNGNFKWARQVGSTGADMGMDLAFDGAGDLYVTGSFAGTVDFDPGPCTFNLVSASSEIDFFLLKLDEAGEFIWSKKFGGNGYDASKSMFIDVAGNIFIAGEFSNSCDFDPSASSFHLSSSGYSDGFILKLSSCSDHTTSTLNVTTCTAYELNCRTYTTSGVYTQVIPNYAGCDSIITLNLHVIPFVQSFSSAAACEYFDWNGKHYTVSGTYHDTLSTASGCDSIATLNLVIMNTTRDTINKLICEGESYEGHTLPGTYIDTFVSNASCDIIRTLILEVVPSPQPQLGPDLSICPGDTLQLNPGSFSIYLWQDGSTGDHYIVVHPGIYHVTISNACGTAQDEIVIREANCSGVWFPTAFTPNNDGRNDLFRPNDNLQISEFNLWIYNRWGQRIFYSRDRTRGWDGNFNNKKLPPGVYVWHCSFKINGKELNWMKGTVVLVR